MTAAPLVEPDAAARPSVEGWVLRFADPILTGLGRHWLGALNAVVGAFIGVAVLAPLLAASGFAAPASALYEFYRGLCHQWAFRSFFLFGPAPIAVYDRDTLAALGTDPFTFHGAGDLGWKMAFCERDLAIFAGLLVFGLLYARRWRAAGLRPSGYLLYGLLAVPMALDGFTQLFGWRESTWELRVMTGLLFGLASAWLLYPRFEASFARGADA